MKKSDCLHKHRRSLVFLGSLVLMGFGGLATSDLFLPANERILATGLQLMIFFGPALLAAGAAIFLLGLLWGSSNALPMAVLATGCLMLLLGIFPWFYTHYLTGGRPGEESAGMLGILIFMLVGLPGLALVLTAVIFGRRPSSWKFGRAGSTSEAFHMNCAPPERDRLSPYRPPRA
jgi:hypothetical protein